MSNFATVAQLRRATSQLPVSWYCDPEIYDAEQRQPVSRARRATSDTSSWCRTSATTVRSKRATTRRRWSATPEGIELVSNICRHRQAIMLQGPRQRREHRLSDPPLDVRPQGRAPRRAAFRATIRACICAARRCTNWHGLLFDGQRDVRPRPRGASPRRTCSTSRTTCSTGSKSTSATTTGRRSSRCISRTTTSSRSIPASASSSPATT